MLSESEAELKFCMQLTKAYEAETSCNSVDYSIRRLAQYKLTYDALCVSENTCACME